MTIQASIKVEARFTASVTPTLREGENQNRAIGGLDG